MNKILHIILISLFSLTIYSCSSSDGDSSTTSTTSDNDTTITDNTTTDNTTTTTTLSAPSGLSASGAAGQVTLDWTALSGASSHTVYWDNASGITSSDSAITSVSTDNYTHSSLTNGSGLGTGSCGPDTLEHYLIPSGSYQFDYVFRSFDPRKTDPTTLLSIKQME